MFVLVLRPHIDTPSITAKLINEQKEDKEKKNYEEKEKVKAENGFQDNYSVVVASGMSFSSLCYKMDLSGVKSVYEEENIYQELISLLVMVRKIVVPSSAIVV